MRGNAAFQSWNPSNFKSPILTLLIICTSSIGEAHRPLRRCCCAASPENCIITSQPRLSVSLDMQSKLP